jgi:hypothetical protein
MDDLARTFGFLFGTFVILLGLMPFMLLGLAIPYAILHVRDSRGVERDPQLGLKTVMYFFFSLCILLVLTGITIIAVDTVRETKQGMGAQPRPAVVGMPPPPARPGPDVWFNSTKRNAAALMFAGFSFGLLQFVLIKTMTNDRRWPLPRRVFGGWRLAFSGLVVLTALTWLSFLFFQEAMQPDALKDPFAVLVVWGPAALVDLVLLRVRSQRSSLAEVLARERIPRAEVIEE